MPQKVWNFAILGVGGSTRTKTLSTSLKISLVRNHLELFHNLKQIVLVILILCSRVREGEFFDWSRPESMELVAPTEKVTKYTGPTQDTKDDRVCSSTVV